MKFVNISVFGEVGFEKLEKFHSKLVYPSISWLWVDYYFNLFGLD